MTINIKTLKEPELVENISFDDLLSTVKTEYEELSGIELKPGQLENIILHVLAARERHLRTLINEVGIKTLLAYATGDVLDHIGATFFNIERLQSSSSRVTLRFQLVESLSELLFIAKGTRVRTSDGKFMFSTIENLNIPSGDIYGDVIAKCDAAGDVGNDYTVNQVNQLVDPLPYISSVYNINISSGGADEESDDHLRERIQIAPESFSVAGPTLAYKFWAKSAHQDIVDVSVSSSSPGTVDIFVLLKDGEIPGQTMLDLVDSVVSADNIRPLTDNVIVSAPTEINYNVDIDITIYDSYSAVTDSIESQAGDKVNEWISELKSKLGKDIVPEQLINKIQSIPGIYRVVVNTPSYTVIENNEVAKVGTINISIVGTADE